MRTIVSSSFILLLFLSCATMMGKMSETSLEAVAERCKEENLAQKPSTKNWHNLSTQVRAKKKREMDDYRKKRIALYQALHQFTTAYTAHVERNGTCRKKECASLELLRQKIIEGCPQAGQGFPVVRVEAQ